MQVENAVDSDKKTWDNLDMGWNEEQISDHQIAAKKLYQIMQAAFSELGKGDISEKSIQSYILDRFKQEGLITDIEPPMVAFRQNTALPHYFAEDDDKLLPESLVMIDLWAKLDKEDAPYADITWMTYFGKSTPEYISEVFNEVILARDAAIDYIQRILSQSKMPIGKDVDALVRGYFEGNGVLANFLHTTGHQLGLDNPHGDPIASLGQRNEKELRTNIGYTIEPGLYFAQKFGIRSEIDFYIDENLNLIVTTELQRELIRI